MYGRNDVVPDAPERLANVSLWFDSNQVRHILFDKIKNSTETGPDVGIGSSLDERSDLSGAAVIVFPGVFQTGIAICTAPIRSAFFRQIVGRRHVVRSVEKDQAGRFAAKHADIAPVPHLSEEWLDRFFRHDT